MVLSGLAILLVLYIIWDVNYFVRFVFTVVLGKLFGKKTKITDETSIYGERNVTHEISFSLQCVLQSNINLSSLGLCTSQDVDIFIRHMNNARYLRELDFARFHFYALTGLYERIKQRGGGAVQGASSIRYRRSIPILNLYKVTTRVRKICIF